MITISMSLLIQVLLVNGLIIVFIVILVQNFSLTFNKVNNFSMIEMCHQGSIDLKIRIILLLAEFHFKIKFLIGNFLESNDGAMMRAPTPNQCGKFDSQNRHHICGLSQWVPYSALKGFSAIDKPHPKLRNSRCEKNK